MERRRGACRRENSLVLLCFFFVRSREKERVRASLGASQHSVGLNGEGVQLFKHPLGLI